VSRRDRKQGQYVLANLVLDLARTRRLEAGHRLTEQSLAEALAVSRTPVRGALQLLAGRGFVAVRPPRGYVLAKSWAELGSSEPMQVPSTVEEDFYFTLIGDRLARTLPEQVTQADLSRRYRINRIALMRTLTRMADEGLLIRNKGRGWRFPPTLDSVNALRESYDFRRTIEPAALLLEHTVVDPVELAGLRQTHEEILRLKDAVPNSRLFAVDAAFHEKLVGFSGNAFFAQAVQQQNRLRRLLEFSGYTNQRRVRAWVGEHLAIIRSLQRGDRAEAAELLARHLDNARRAATLPARGGRRRGNGGAAAGDRG
jgi:DNA-binding GntR family transcriptional regulator